MNRFNVIAFTHAGIGLEELSNFHLDPLLVEGKMLELKRKLQLDEIMYLSTCNRVEFIYVHEREIDTDFLELFVKAFRPEFDENTLRKLVKKGRFWNGINAVNHLIEVATSLDSMVLGEREIITQVRNAYDFAKAKKLSGDTIRVVIRQTIETAKKVFTQTSISEKSVSVVSLAYQSLAQRNIPLDARILVVGSGVTNQNMCKFLVKHGYSNFKVFNRTLSSAQKLAAAINGEAARLSEFPEHSTGFDILITCTGANNAIITPTNYSKVCQGDRAQKLIVDLAIPTDVDAHILEKFNVDYISVASVKDISESNLKERRKELLRARQIIYESLEAFKEIFEMRQMEIKMRKIPEKVKAIRQVAETEVFSKELSALDEESKLVLGKILNYMEKKYVSVPMLMAKEILTKIK